MTGLSEDEAAPRPQLTRRERRLAKSRARRAAALVGWLGYGMGVFVVVMAAAWLAVRGGTVPTPERGTNVTRVQPVIAIPDFTTSTTTHTVTPAESAAPVEPVAPSDPTAATTSTTTAPVLSVAATPAPTDTTP